MLLREEKRILTRIKQSPRGVFRKRSQSFRDCVVFLRRVVLAFFASFEAFASELKFNLSAVTADTREGRGASEMEVSIDSQGALQRSPSWLAAEYSHSRISPRSESPLAWMANEGKCVSSRVMGSLVLNILCLTGTYSTRWTMK
jgi:hypothetical protein